MKKNKITTPHELRSVLLAAMEGVVEGRVTVSQGNAVAAIAQEVHKSIKSEWDMRCYASENFPLNDKGGIVSALLEGGDKT